jgi:ubiquinol-cytochrome c reductase cytochrome c1 subunit
MGLAESSFEPARTDIHDIESLQRGARNFVQNCVACHSARYVRWSQLTEDLALPAAELQTFLAPTGAKPHDTIAGLMPAEQAVMMLGVEPPDLSLMARARGVDYLYAFLRSFYSDPTRRTGVNNLVQPYTAMPHVLAPLQGMPRPKTVEVTRNGKVSTRVIGIVTGTPGSMPPQEFDRFVRDTVNFLDYMSQPVKARRERLGWWMVPLLLLLWLLTYLLKREYWKDIPS